MAAAFGPLPVSLPDPSCLTLDEVTYKGGSVIMTVSAALDGSACPRCGVRSHSVHSRYSRSLRDLPCHGTTVRICLRTYRFYCRVHDCPRRVFAQRLPAVAPPYSRQTCRHRNALLAIGYALGGEAGCRLTSQLGIDSSADTILRILRQAGFRESDGEIKVLGVDDWAWRRGHRYGTVLVDLERRRPVDLLPDRESDTLARWLRAHPTVEIISRDRAGAYAEGARRGAPQAVQVADRFHLLCNLTQALQRVLERLSGALSGIKLAEASGSDAVPGEAGTDETQAAQVIPETSKPLTRKEKRNDQSREKRKAIFDAVKAAHHRGATKQAIARELGLTRTTVRRYLQAEEFPERAPRRQRSELDSFRQYLEKRWGEGCHNASQLCRELRQKGYGGQRSRVKEYVQPWRKNSSTRTGSTVRRSLPNLRLVSIWLTKFPAQRSSDEQSWVDAVTAAHPQVGAAVKLAQEFRQVFVDRNAEALKRWIQQSAMADIPELKGFASGIQRDYAAVAAAAEQHWSNGQVEGQVHRLKLLKRQMYGRSGFQLLRHRVLPQRAP